MKALTLFLFGHLILSPVCWGYSPTCSLWLRQECLTHIECSHSVYSCTCPLTTTALSGPQGTRSWGQVRELGPEEHRGTSVPCSSPQARMPDAINSTRFEECITKSTVTTQSPLPWANTGPRGATATHWQGGHTLDECVCLEMAVTSGVWW